MNSRKQSDERTKNFQHVREIYLDHKAEGKVQPISHYGKMMGAHVANDIILRFLNCEITTKAFYDEVKKSTGRGYKKAMESFKQWVEFHNQHHDEWQRYLRKDWNITRVRAVYELDGEALDKLINEQNN